MSFLTLYVSSELMGFSKRYYLSNSPIHGTRILTIIIKKVLPRWACKGLSSIIWDFKRLTEWYIYIIHLYMYIHLCSLINPHLLIAKDLIIIYLWKDNISRYDLFYIYKCHSVTSGLQWLLLVLWTLLLIAENIIGFAYSPLKEWSFITRSLKDWFLCYICFLLIFSAKLLLPPLLMTENWGDLFWLCLFPPQDISLFYLLLSSLCHPWEFSSELWQSEGHLKIILWAEWTAIWALSVFFLYKTS